MLVSVSTGHRVSDNTAIVEQNSLDFQIILDLERFMEKNIFGSVIIDSL